MKTMNTLWMVFFLVIVLALTVEAQQPLKSQWVSYTTDLAQMLREKYPDRTEQGRKQMMLKDLFFTDIRRKQAMDNTDSSLRYQDFYIITDSLELTEDWYERRGQAKAVYEAFLNPDEEAFCILDAYRMNYDLEVLSPVVLTRYLSQSRQAKNINVRIYNTDGNPAARFLSMVTPDRIDHTCQAYEHDLPENHINKYYVTFGGAGQMVDVFAHLDSIWIYYTNTQTQQPDSAYVPVGDAEHNVLDPERGWDLSVVMGKNPYNFQTNPDTLTIKTIKGKPSRLLQLYPGWNDVETGEVIYVAGEDIYANMIEYQNQDSDQDPNQVEYFIGNTRKDGYEALVGCVMALPQISDVAYTSEYIVVRYLDALEVPHLEVSGDSLNPGDLFTVSLTGTPELMTSWVPQITISGVDAELISKDGFVWTYRIQTSGEMQVTLHHHGLRRDLEDETETLSVGSNGVDDLEEFWSVYPNPTQNYIIIPNHNLTNFEYSIYSLNGEEVLRKSSEVFDMGDGSYRIDVSNLIPGNYILRLKGTGKSFKFIKE